MSFLPSDDREWLETLGWAYEEIAEVNKRGVIVRGFALPQGKFQVDRADILVQIPQGYPDAQLDMFWCQPMLQIVPSGKLPNATVSETHFGTNWQRWSRHYKPGQWRPGIDDLRSHFKVVSEALRKAS